MPIKLLNWNLEWAKRGTARGERIAQIIENHDPAIACVTETYEDYFATGHTITSTPDYGYPLKTGRRKVMLWSREGKGGQKPNWLKWKISRRRTPNNKRLELT